MYGPVELKARTSNMFKQQLFNQINTSNISMEEVIQNVFYRSDVFVFAEGIAMPLRGYLWKPCASAFEFIYRCFTSKFNTTSRYLMVQGQRPSQGL